MTFLLELGMDFASVLTFSLAVFMIAIKHTSVYKRIGNVLYITTIKGSIKGKKKAL